MSKAWYILTAKTDSCSLSCCTNYPTLVQQASLLSCCVLTGVAPPPEHSDRESIGCLCSSMLVRHKPVKLPVSVRQTDLHEPIFF